jgi:hypothetical protein
MSKYLALDKVAKFMSYLKQNGGIAASLRKMYR